MPSESSNEQLGLSASVYRVGGSLPVDAPTYVERQADRDLYDRLKAGECCYVFNSRQMGKSSLRVRTIQKLERDGIRCATLDPQTIGTQLDQSQWYASVISSLVESFGLEDSFDLETWWEARPLLSPVRRLNDFISKVLLVEISQPIVIFVEEIDNLLNLKEEMADDFFMLIRSFYESRDQDSKFNRLSFAFVGVTTPRELIRGHNHSAFNIGVAIAMEGFQLEEVPPLAIGLEGKVSDPSAVMVEVLKWTGGQPFLTQKLLSLVIAELEHGNDLSGKDIAGWVAEVVRLRIIDNWEAQDVPQHLKTLQDRILRIDERGRGRLLGLYQQVLGDAPQFWGGQEEGLQAPLAPQFWGEQEDDKSPSIGGFRGLDVENVSYGIAADDSDEQIQLRLTGLVVKRGNRLTVYNPIYAAVFNQSWVERTLADLRPEFYGSAFREWQGAEQKDGFLLRGEALKNAEVWARGKRLSDADDEFLRESREIEKVESNLKLEAERQARETAEQERLIALKQQETAEEEARVLEKRAIILDDAKQKADRRVKAGSAILTMTLALATVAGLWAARSLDKANDQVSQTKKNAQDKVDKANLTVDGALKKAKDIEDNARRKAAFDSWNAEKKVKEAVTKKEEADRNVEKSQKNLESAKLELENVSQQSLEKVLSAQAQVLIASAKIVDAERKESEAKLKISIAEARLNSANAKATFFDKREFESLLLALRAGSQLRQFPSYLLKDINGIFETTLTLEDILYHIQEKNRLNCAQEAVVSVAISPDGEMIATAGWDGTVKLWSKEGEAIKTLPKREGIITSVAFSHDGKTIGIVNYPGTVILFNREGMRPEIVLKQQESIRSIVFSPVDNEFITTSDNGIVRLWNLETLESNIFTKHDGFSNATFSHDGLTIASVSYGNIQVRDRKNKELIFPILQEDGAGAAIEFSPNGELIAISSDKNVKFLNKKGRIIRPLIKHEEPVTSIAFSPNGLTIATASPDRKIYISDIHGQLLKTFVGHGGGIVYRGAKASIAFSPDSQLLVTANYDNFVKIWSMDNQETKTLLKTFAGVVKTFGVVKSKLALSSNGETIAVGTNDGIVKVENTITKEIKTILTHEGIIAGLTFSPDGKTIAIGSGNGNVKIVNINGKEIYSLQNHKGVTSLAFSSNEKTIAIGSDDGTVKLWNTDGQETKTILSSRGSITRIAFSPDGKLIAISSADRTVILSNDGKEAKPLSGHTDTVNDVQFSPDGQTIVTVGDDGNLILWDKNGERIKTISGHYNGIKEVLFMPDSQTFLTLGGEGKVKLWNQKGTELYTLRYDQVVNIARSSDGKVALITEDGKVRLLNFNINNLLHNTCAWLHDYLANNPSASDDDRQMCGIPPRQK